MGPSVGRATIAPVASPGQLYGDYGGVWLHKLAGMLRFFKFRDEFFAPQPAKDVYVKRPEGRGWAEECPPIRAANAFGYDLLANFDVVFLKNPDGTWRSEADVEVSSDFDWSVTDTSPSRPLVQRYAWFWEKGQTLPHVITDDVFESVRNQVKLSTFLFLATDANEVALMTDPPNAPPMHQRGWRAMSAMIELDWYPASYPWHVVLELDASRDRVAIAKGDVIARLMPLRRDTYFAKPMTETEFDDFFTRGQRWLSTHGKPHDSGAGEALDITRTYVKQQARSRFVVLD